jgi:hypothetical protein
MEVIFSFGIVVANLTFGYGFTCFILDLLFKQGFEHHSRDSGLFKLLYLATEWVSPELPAISGFFSSRPM